MFPSYFFHFQLVTTCRRLVAKRGDGTGQLVTYAENAHALCDIISNLAWHRSDVSTSVVKRAAVTESPKLERTMHSRLNVFIIGFPLSTGNYLSQTTSIVAETDDGSHWFGWENCLTYQVKAQDGLGTNEPVVNACRFRRKDSNETKTSQYHIYNIPIPNQDLVYWSSRSPHCKRTYVGSDLRLYIVDS